MISFVSRNLKVFFRDKTAVFFSLLAVLIVLGLYIFFLGDVWVDSFPNIKGVKNLMNCWIIAELIGVTSVTANMGAFGTMIEDKSKNKIKDFYVLPIKKSKIVGGYIISSFIVGSMMSVVTLIISQIYLVYSGVDVLNFKELTEVFLIILMTSLSNSAMILFIVSLFSSEKAFSTASTIVGTLIGFITGIYLPISMLPDSVQIIVKLFPTSHGISILRQIFMKKQMDISFADVPTNYINEFKESMGVVYYINDKLVSNTTSIFILIASTIIFFFLAVLILYKKKK
ncbi:ABC transporter permease [Intestinibacter bartlettii]|uniref:ABC transporter permease n=1 Tax=Intestinibacter bartlettii TaxID=261299 RepID=A0ABS8CTY6_9FIRM|nr:ABC transporter permease [Intestinibacter bartlettii]MCB5396128.1 ABC transporter permease [Intestinibacter bartlettii]MCB5402677.1 ABC transporter permease [Intestinibacter bartlettii]MCB5444933.1 ABC transporter permease [Intestinibacter bartlettii]MCB5719516.1 ABC transporter permease [Intestinibacter bartlettii]MCB5747453.1 ABC transporter permease [Intestinibacter bartlettii]